MANDDIMPRMHADPGLMTALLAHINADLLPALRSSRKQQHAGTAQDASAAEGRHVTAGGPVSGQGVHAEHGSGAGLEAPGSQQALGCVGDAASGLAQQAEGDVSEEFTAPAGKRLATADKVERA